MLNPADTFRRAWEKCFHRYLEVNHYTFLGGGSINQVCKVDTEEGSFVMKVNSLSRYPGMFKAEAEGLRLLGNSKTIAVPEVVAIVELQQQQVLLLEYIESSKRTANFFEVFGQQLAALHQNTAPVYGLHFNNRIGSLPQDNSQEETLINFFIHRRLEPQLRLAVRQGKLNSDDEKKFEVLYKKLLCLLPDEKPALIHGDLWKGNFICGNDGTAWLIDPAVAYSCREADIAMSKLFGGFEDVFYQAYTSTFPLSENWEQRIDLWNLYPLLVHVNLFGGTYSNDVRAILKRFTHI